MGTILTDKMLTTLVTKLYNVEYYITFNLLMFKLMVHAYHMHLKFYN